MKSAINQFDKLVEWGKNSENVRALVMTGSRAEPGSYADILSDYDIELYVRELNPFMNDDWLLFLGEVMIRWPLEPGHTFSKQWLTRLIICSDGNRFDFQITSLQNPDISTLRHGYKILIDKDGLFTGLNEGDLPDYSISKPDKDKFQEFVNAFFWDATYIAKSLKRDELFYAKYMLDSNLRFSKLQVMLEWYIGFKNDPPVNMNKYGRFFRKYLPAELWNETEKTFAGAGIDDNWEAFFNMIELFSKISREIAGFYKFNYPEATGRAVTEYCKKIRSMDI